MEEIPQDRWWERFWRFKPRYNNQHDLFMIWADIKLSKNKSVLYE
jgi:hypothetical protein